MSWMGRVLVVGAIIGLALMQPVQAGAGAAVRLGNEVLLEQHLHLVMGKRVGLVTNHTGVTSRGESLVDVLARHNAINLAALYTPEHGLDGVARAGEWVQSYTHPVLNIPVYSLYGPTRKPTGDMLRSVDVLLFDIQDIGARSYTYMSTLNYCLLAAREHGKPVLVLDRPNPLGGMRVEGPMMEDRFISFVGVDNLPKAHGMTAGELARFFNRKIGADVTVIPMQGYHRNMIFQDTGLPWVGTSPNIQDLDSCFGYMATGLGEGTGVFQADRFKWIGGSGLNSTEFADRLNAENLGGVLFVPETRGSAGGARLVITDHYSFNPARTGIYGLATAFLLGDFRIPRSNGTIVMFDKIMGTNKFGDWLASGLTPAQIEQQYRPALDRFARDRTRYLLPEYEAVVIVKVSDQRVLFDTDPFIDQNDRVQVPIRAIATALGARVHWNERLREVSIERPGQTIRLTIGSTAINVDGSVQAMDTSPVIVNGRTMVPARFVAEYLGETVRWDGEWLMVHIN